MASSMAEVVDDYRSRGRIRVGERRREIDGWSKKEKKSAFCFN